MALNTPARRGNSGRHHRRDVASHNTPARRGNSGSCRAPLIHPARRDESGSYSAACCAIAAAKAGGGLEHPGPAGRKNSGSEQ